MPAFALPVLALLAQAAARVPSTPDPRADYDVDAYHLDLRVDPATRTLSGSVEIRAHVTAPELATLVLDLQPPFVVSDVRESDGPALAFTHTDKLLHCDLGHPRAHGAALAVVVTYSGCPTARDNFTGFHWKTTSDGKPWIATSCQDPGSSSWWPGKDSFFHPEDKPARVDIDLTVPLGLVGVANGRLAGRETKIEGTETFHWRHPYPLETYSVAINVAPYVTLEREVTLDGLEKPLHTQFFALPEHVERAQKTFDDVPAMLAIFGRAFGPFPFPDAKYALVETPFWGMEHSTCVAYGSSFPAWLAVHGGQDKYASRNERFDYILVHESAHEWWGNGVSARSWGDFWIHEGFATYAEALYVEAVRGEVEAQAHMNSWESSIGARAQLFRGENVDSEQAYSLVLYAKGAWVLHTLRAYVADDDAWWRALRAFQAGFRYGNATTDDFRAVLENETKRDWKRFFDEWVRGRGQPKLEGRVRVGDTALAIEVDVEKTADTDFHVPLDLAWTVNGTPRTQRVELAPGPNRLSVPTAGAARDVRVVGLDRILGRHRIPVVNAEGG